METMKRKLKIKIWTNLSVTAELTDARWKKLVGDYFEPTEQSWAEDYESSIETWAETEIPEFMGHLLGEKLPSSIVMAHRAEDSNGTETLHVEVTEAEEDGIEITDAHEAA